MALPEGAVAVLHQNCRNAVACGEVAMYARRRYGAREAFEARRQYVTPAGDAVEARYFAQYARWAFACATCGEPVEADDLQQARERRALEDR